MTRQIVVCRLGWLVVIVALVLAGSGVARAQSAPFCQADESPRFSFGFGALKTQLADAMGDPVECEHANPDNGDTLQHTTTGLSFYRRSTNTPTFTDGFNHWGLTGAGLVSWTGSSIDPPAAMALPSAVATPAPTASASAGPVAPPATTPSPPPTSQACGAPANPWGYTFCGGTVLTSPPSNLCSYFACIASFWNQTNGYVARCRDGLLSHSGGVRGACSSHGGVAGPLFAP